jgi:hypothetical protein
VSIADDRIDDDEIGPMWAEHYPKHKSHVFSKALVIVLCKILRNKAQHGIAYGDWSDKCHHVLVQFGIPKEQFQEIEKIVNSLPPAESL